MGTSIRWVEGTHIIYKKHLNISISDKGVKNWLKELIYLQYDQNFIFCPYYEPEIPKRGIVFIGSPGIIISKEDDHSLVLL